MGPGTHLPVYAETDTSLAPVQEDLQAHGVNLYVREALPGPSTRRGYEDWVDWTAWHLAYAKVHNPRSNPPHREPARLAVKKEARALRGERDPPGPLYDGHRLMEAYHGPLPDAHATPGRPVIVLTDRMMATHQGDRYHVRFLLAGHPTIVSTPGFIDGPARDRAFYFAKQALGSAHGAEELIDDDHLSRSDERLSTCIASALLQAIKYAQTGDPFCKDDGCRLFNPHWQDDLVSTMATRDLCPDHGTWAQNLDAPASIPHDTS